jgi:hypothetical protein
MGGRRIGEVEDEYGLKLFVMEVFGDECGG